MKWSLVANSKAEEEDRSLKDPKKKSAFFLNRKITRVRNTFAVEVAILTFPSVFFYYPPLLFFFLLTFNDPKAKTIGRLSIEQVAKRVLPIQLLFFSLLL